MIVKTYGKPGEGMTHRNLLLDQFPVRFRQLRKDLKLKQAAMAERLGISLQTLQRYEKGTTSPTADVLERVAALGVDLQWLVTGTPSNWPCSHVLPGVVFFAFRSEQLKDIESLLQQKGISIADLHRMMGSYVLELVNGLKSPIEKPL